MKAKKEIPKTNTKDPEGKALVKSPNLFPVVGIGASAGGLDAFKKLLKAIPEDSGMAYVLVQHLDPSHESMLQELLQKVTNIPVLEIADDIKVEPNHIYVIPSNKMMVATDGVLLLAPRPAKNKNERNLPIDLFFSSLAEVHQSHAIGVVLSGTASDGTLGLKAIKDHGGITFAQDEASAAYEGMPHSAAQAGVVDFILPPEKIPQKILEVTKIINGNGPDAENIPMQDEEVFKQILSLLRIRKGTDFTYYKQTTIRRRILRRMAINKNEEPVVYLKYLRENKPEQDVLYQDLLIPVTSFFRDPKTFDNLCETVFPLIVKNKQSGEPIRVWVAGCSTGEEAYSIAICLKEFLGFEGSDSKEIVQIFATDISEPAITKARAGIYTKTDAESLSPQRLQEFFIRQPADSYLINKSIRDMCVFAAHNFLKDPPFGKMDLISCRNVLIYMEPYLQKKALTTFHYALNPKGVLLLGKSETTSGVPELFTLSQLKEGKSDKLFARKDVPGKFMHVASQRSEQHFSQSNTSPGNESVRTDFQKTADDIMLRKYTPAGVVVNEAMDIVHFRGNTANYLQQSPGKPSHNLLKMAKDGLAFELRNILHKAKKQKAPVIKENIPVDINGVLQQINIEALRLPDTIEPHYLVLFHQNQPLAISGEPLAKGKGKANSQQLTANSRIAQLEKELAQSREDMRSITEDQEASNEELQSSNEELLSSSEELQSLNEELETGKEELQSTNEELTIVNQEMISLNEQVTTARDYSEAIIANMHEPLLVLDKNLRIKTGNNAFYKTFRVNEKETEDVLIYELGNNQWDIPELRRLLEKILPEKSVFNDFEVTHTFSTIGERIMLLNAREVINKAGSEKLILLSIEDITERKKAQEVLRKTSEQFKHLVKDLPAAVYSCDAAGHINFYNDAAVKLWGREPDPGKDLWCGSFKIFKPDGSPLALENCPMALALKEGRAIMGEELIIERPDGGRSNVLAHPQPEFGLSGEITGAINMIFDITEQVLARKKLEQSEYRFANMVYSSPSLISILKGEDLIIEIANDAILTSWGKGKDVIGKPLLQVLPEIVEQGFGEIFNNVYKTGITFEANEMPTHLLRNGKMELVYYTFSYQAQRNINNEVEGISIIANEVTPQAEYNINLRESEQRFRSLADNVPIHIFIIEPDAAATISYWNKNWLDYVGKTFEEAIGNTWGGVMHPDDLKGIMDVYVPAFEKRQAYFLPGIRIRRHDGEYRWHSVQANPRYLPNGEFIGYIGIGVDIHEKKLAEDALKESESYFRQLADLMPAKISNAKIDGEVTYFNKSWLDFAGFSFEELRDFGYHQIMHPDELEEFETRFQKAAATGTDLVMEMRFKNKAGDYVWHLNIASPVKDENGVHKMWVGVTTDISGPKKQREELEKAVAKRTNQLLEVNKELEQKNQEVIATKEKLLTEYSRSLIEASLDPLVTINIAGKVTDMNQATANITGISRNKLTGSDFFDYFTEPEKAQEVYKEVFAKGSVVNSPLTLRHVNGKLTDVLLNGSVYKDGKGKELGVVLVARDVTKEKRIATELTEAIVFAQDAKRTAEEATRTAEDAVKAKQQFLSNMSHEIRTPMNAIIGFTKVVLKTELTVKQKEYLTAIKLSGNSLIVLINDILDLAKVDAGKMSFEEIPFKMASSIAAMIHLFETKVQEKNLELVKVFDEKIPEVLLGDPVRLHQIILNLVSNAVKFTSKGKITVSLHVIKEDTEKVSIEFSVADTGTGIEADKTEKIFEKFHQASSDTSRLYGGTGLGLAIVKQLVESQGGHISVQSKVNEGSVFSFTLSFKKTDEKAEVENEIMEPDAENKNIKVLVVEDIALNQLLMKTLLDDFGFERDIAANGKIAIEKLQEKNYDVILMDLQMPEMNGFEATEYIRNTMHSKIPIIALTADVTTVDLEKCKAVGMNDYIAKPVDERILYSKIVGLVKKPVEKKTVLSDTDITTITKKINYTDLTYLTGITKFDTTLIMEMIELYLEQTPVLINALTKSLAAEDWDGLHAAAHKLIPSFSIMGISKEYEMMAKTIQEYKGAKNEVQKTAELALQLQHVCSEACAELKEEYNTLKNTKS